MVTDLEMLRKEFEKENNMGELIYGEIIQIALGGPYRHKYNFKVYNEGRMWNDSELENLAHDVILLKLINERQLDYALAHANDLNHFRSLIKRYFKQVLNKRLKKSAVQRLLDRIKDLQVESDAPWEFALSDSNYQILSEDDVKRIVNMLHDIPQIAENPSASRASMIYKKEHLQQIVTRVRAEAVNISKDDFKRILNDLLTGWAPTFPLTIDDINNPVVLVEKGNGEKDIEENEILMEARKYVSHLSDENKNILWQRLQGVNYGQIANEIGRTYQTVSTRFNKLMDDLKSFVKLEKDEDEENNFLKYFWVALNEAIGNEREVIDQ